MMQGAQRRISRVRTQFLWFLCRAAAAAAFCCATALAGFNTDGQKGAVRTLSAKTMGAMKLDIGAGLSIFQSKGFVSDVVNPRDSAVADTSRDAARMLSANLFLGVGLAQFCDIGLSLPFYADWLGFDNLSDNGIGDLEISAKFLYPPLNKRLFYQAYYVAATVPVGVKSGGFFPRNPYYIEGGDTNPARTFYSSDYATVNGMVLLTFDFSAIAPSLPLQAHLNMGGVISSSLRHQRNTAVLSCALEYAPLDILTLYLDFHGESRWSTLSTSLDPSKDPMLLSPAIRLTTASGLYLTLTGDIALSSRAAGARFNWRPAEGSAKGYRYSTGILPGFGVQFTLGWCGYAKEPDEDHDGIPNRVDKCPKEPEDFDGFQDDDGCPDYDNDNDGIPDSLDKCPNRAEDRDGFQDEDGCPDTDNDQDGIPDSVDQCPNFHEDFDGFRDADGCPDYDNDRDGIPDSVDKCPNDPEDIDGFRDADGCPDADNDQDNVADTLDKCPNVPGVAANRGCPPDTAKPVKKEDEFPKSQILSGVSFRKGTAELTFESYQFLEPIIRKLKGNPEVEVEVHGHTDAVGDYAKNMRLSQMRADAVRLYLIGKGIAAERIRAVGFGSSSPIADNKTAAGRAQNRRLELVRVK
jgi:outer membrane protein OmpA-like peptidoglycan-associated protein